MAIMERAMQKRGITKRALGIEGQRHFMLVNLLSSGVTRLLTREELMGAIKKITPRYAKEDDCWQLVADWYQELSQRRQTRERRTWHGRLQMCSTPSTRSDKHELDDVDDEVYPGDVSDGRCGMPMERLAGMQRPLPTGYTVPTKPKENLNPTSP
jgi:hypothetical protein